MSQPAFSIRDSATYLNEWFSSLTAAGFTEEQAMTVCLQLVQGWINQSMVDQWLRRRGGG